MLATAIAIADKPHHPLLQIPQGQRGLFFSLWGAFLHIGPGIPWQGGKELIIEGPKRTLDS